MIHFSSMKKSTSGFASTASSTFANIDLYQGLQLLLNKIPNSRLQIPNKSQITGMRLNNLDILDFLVVRNYNL